MERKFSISTIPIPADNYAYLLQWGDQAAVVDPSSAAPVLELLQARGLKLDFVFSTHFHADHTGGNAELKKQTGCSIVGPDERVASVDRVVAEGDVLVLGKTPLEVLHVPGHTRTQVAYYLPDQNCLFAGDTMFAAGCGRISEVTPERMYESLMRLASLPDATMIYCGHEYTVENLEFAAQVEPDNGEVLRRLERARILRARNQPTVPTTVALEKLTNPFLRSGLKSVRDSLGMTTRSPVAVFTELRRRKDVF